jgi:hypothetical protein
MELLERGAFLESLESWLADARNGEGCMVLLGGEAGIGKTAPRGGVHIAILEHTFAADAHITTSSSRTPGPALQPGVARRPVRSAAPPT